ncbi:MAG TPA: GLPGLI family protein [Chitinophagaceae bacterium]
MKKSILPLIALVVTQMAAGQMKEGKIIYDGAFQLNFQIRESNSELQKMIPKTQNRQYELLFSGNQSLFQSLPDIKEEANEMGGPSHTGGPVVNIMRFGGDNIVYHNFEAGKRISEIELSAKNYIVEENISKLNWKLTEESKTILGHKVFKATADRFSTRTMVSMENGEMKRKQMPDTSKVVAWFAADIPVPAGPDFQGQLPGLILELDLNNGRTVYKAIEISPKVNVASIKQPSRGKKISAEEFAKEQQKMMDQMQQQRRPGGNGERIVISSSQ